MRKLYWFYGHPGNSDHDTKKQFIESLIAIGELEPNGRLTKVLNDAVLDMDREDGIYLLDVENYTCNEVKSTVGETALTLIKMSSCEIYVDMAKREEIEQNIKAMEEKIESLRQKLQILKTQQVDIESEIKVLTADINKGKLRMKRLDLKEPVAKEGDYVVVKNEFNKGLSVFHVLEVKINNYMYSWEYKVHNIVSTNMHDYSYILGDKIVSTIKSQPKLKKGDVVNMKGDNYKVNMVRYSTDENEWRYKLTSVDGPYKSTFYVLESEF